MTVPASTVPAVMQALVAGITTQVNDPEVLVTYYEEGTWKPNDIITVGTVNRTVLATGVVGSGAAGWLHEEYTVEVKVSSYIGGDDPATITARAWALTAAVETFVRTDPSLGGLLLEMRPESSTAEGRWDDNDTGRFVDVTTPIYCYAQT